MEHRQRREVGACPIHYLTLRIVSPGRRKLVGKPDDSDLWADAYFVDVPIVPFTSIILSVEVPNPVPESREVELNSPKACDLIRGPKSAKIAPLKSCQLTFVTGVRNL